MSETENKKIGLGTAGLVLGIVGVCTSFIPIINNLSAVMGVLAVIFGIIAVAKDTKKVKAIIIIILGILTIVAVLNSQKALSEALNEVSKGLDKATGGQTQEILANEVEVAVIGNFKVNTKNYITETKLTVKVANKTSEKKSFSITIEALDKDGTRITQDYIYANDLNAGQSQNFEIFTFVESDKIEIMKTATFNIVEASSY